MECNSNSFASNYGLVYRYTGSVSYESAICPDDTASPNYE